MFLLTMMLDLRPEESYQCIVYGGAFVVTASKISSSSKS